MELDLHMLTCSFLRNTNNMILHLELRAFFFFFEMYLGWIKDWRKCENGYANMLFYI